MKESFWKEHFWELWASFLYVLFRVFTISEKHTLQEKGLEFVSNWLEHVVFLLIVITFVTLLKLFKKEMSVAIISTILGDKFKRILQDSLASYFYNDKLLEVPIQAYTSHISGNINSYVKYMLVTKISNAITSITKCNTDNSIDVDSSELYLHVRNTLNDCNEFVIIDHDINRWRELNDSHGSKSHVDNTFNYSEEILARTKERAKSNRTFKLKRIFVIHENEWQFIACTNSKIKCERNCKYHGRSKAINNKKNPLKDIVKQIHNAEIATSTGGEKGRVETRLCVYEWLVANKPSIAEKLTLLKDIVIVDSGFILREKFDITTRERSDKTSSEVSCGSVDINECLNLFNNLWDEDCIVLSDSIDKSQTGK